MDLNHILAVVYCVLTGLFYSKISAHLHYMCVSLCVHLSVRPSLCPPVYNVCRLLQYLASEVLMKKLSLCVCLSVCLSVPLSVRPSLCLSVYIVCRLLQYLAPEILMKQPYDRCVDWWCLGSVLYEMLFGLVSPSMSSILRQQFMSCC